MTDRWHEVDALFDHVLDIQDDERASFLDAACQGDHELRETVQKLLAAHVDSSDFLEEPPSVPPEVLSTAKERVESESRDRTGELIGPYRVLEEIGRGGMASVYLAERADGQFERHVALKILRRGIDTDDVVARFRAERQILSNLDDPRIARMYGGGSTEDGLPWLAMEHVDGLRITDHCDSRHCTTEERVQLFLDVARAVHYAHGRLVVHRDIKPSNVLVRTDGQIKLLDFGIAKILDPAEAEGTPITRTDVRPLTPRYASPELVAGAPVLTASDVYQLGLLLYELLTGTLPYEIEGSTPGALALSLERADVSRPSDSARRTRLEEAALRAATPERLSRELKGDIDAILLKALERDPDRRYSSAIELVEDLRRYIEGRPVSARRAGTAYKVRKFFRRQPWALPVIGVFLAIGGSYVALQMLHKRQLTAERNAARAEATKASAVTDVLVDLFRTVDPWHRGAPEAGADVTVREALALGADRVRAELAGQPALQADLFDAIADVYLSIGLPELAMPLVGEARDRARETHGVTSAQAAFLDRQMGRVLSARGQRDSAALLLERSLAMSRALAPEGDTATAGTLLELARLEQDRGNFEECERLLLESAGLFSSHADVPPERLASVHSALGAIYPHLDRLDDARLEAEKAVALLRAEYGDDNPRTAVAQVDLADALDLSGRDEEAVDVYRSAIAVLERTLGEGHPETNAAINNLAVTLGDLDRLEEAELEHRRIVAIRIDLTGEWDPDVAGSLQNLGVTLGQQGKYDEAEETLLRAWRIYRAVLEPGHYLSAYPLLTLSGLQLERGDFIGAESSAREATTVLEVALPEGHFATAMARCRVGRALLGQSRTSLAEPYLRDAAPILVDAPQLTLAYRQECLSALADLLDTTGRGAEAEAYRAVYKDSVAGS